jgi:hypothetical protein
MKQQIEKIIKKNLPEKVDEKEAKFVDDPNNLLGEGYSIGFNQALSQIDTSLIADEVLKVVKEKYDPIFKWLLGENGDFPESEQGKRYNFRTELRKRLQLLNNLK